jgi:aminomethyltransferase
VVPNDAAIGVFDALLAAGERYGIVPAGLGARDTLRTEMGYPLHGQDISPEITPVQARLGWAVGWKKDAFWGHRALRAEKEAGPTRVLRGLLAVGRGIPRPGMTVLGADDAPVGEVTSGTFSPSLKKGVALALVGSGLAEGDEVSVDVRGRREPFEIVKPPFVSVHVRED